MRIRVLLSHAVTGKVLTLSNRSGCPLFNVVTGTTWRNLISTCRGLSSSLYSTSRRTCAGRHGWLHQLVRQTGAVSGASRSDELEMSSATIFTKSLSMNRFSDQGKVACNPDCQIDFLFIHDQDIASSAFCTKASPLDNNHFDQLMGNEHHIL